MAIDDRQPRSSAYFEDREDHLVGPVGQVLIGDMRYSILDAAPWRIALIRPSEPVFCDSR